MRRLAPVLFLAMCAVPLLSAAAGGAGGKLPMFGGKAAVATVNGEPILLSDLNEAVASLHEGAEGKASPGGRDPSEILDRIINAALILQEARAIGLDELPEVKQAVDAFAASALRERLLLRQVRGERPDRDRVEALYKEAVREAKITSVLFPNAEDAKAAEEELAGGADFDNMVRRVLREKTARGSGEGAWFKTKDLLPEISEWLSSARPGQVSPPIKAGGGTTILRLEEIRYPDVPETKAQAEKEALKQKRLQAINDYVDGLKKRYVKLRKKTLDGLDFEAKSPGFDNLLADRRTLASVAGEKPVTVGDLAAAVKEKFFHGVELAAGEKKLNKAKEDVLAEILSKRVLRKEALRRKIDREPAYRDRVEGYRKGVLFGLFVRKAVDPDIRVEPAELQAYYGEHKSSYASPGSMRLRTLAFDALKPAEDALDKLRKGAEFHWVRANAEGQVGREKRGILRLDDDPVTLDGLPEWVRKAVSGASPGDYRLCAGPDGVSYVVFVKEATAPRTPSFEEVRGEIERIVFDGKRQKAVEEWARKLRAVADIRLFATGPALYEALRK